MKLTIREIADLKEGRKTLSEIQYYKSYFHKPHLGNLPHDLHTNDIDKLKERLDACREAQKKDEEELKKIDDIIELNEMEVESGKIAIDKLSQENEELLAQNKQISETVKKVYNHFEDVTMLTEEDGWEIKKGYLRALENSKWEDTDFEKKMHESMLDFVDNVTLNGYIDKTYINHTLNPLIRYVRTIDKSVAKQMEDYRDKYNISEDTSLTRQLDKIESDGNLSDKWYEIQGANEKKIKQNNEKIESSQKTIEQMEQVIKDKSRERRKVSTRINDYQQHGRKISEKIGNLQN